MRRFLTIFKRKCSHLRPLLSITFPHGFRISKNIGHLTSGSGGKKAFKRYLKSEHTHTHTDRQTDGLIESIGPEGRCFEKFSIQVRFETWTLEYLNPFWNLIFGISKVNLLSFWDRIWQNESFLSLDNQFILHLRISFHAKFRLKDKSFILVTKSD